MYVAKMSLLSSYFLLQILYPSFIDNEMRFMSVIILQQLMFLKRNTIWEQQNGWMFGEASAA